MKLHSALSPLALLVAFPALLSAQAPAAVRGTVMDSVRRVPLADVRDSSGLGINALPPDWVYGVEIYRWGDASPPRFHNGCGLILIWTK